jgi:hypothetical protein
VLVVYEPPAEEHSWFLQCRDGISSETIPRRRSTFVRLCTLRIVATTLPGLALSGVA